MNLCKSKNTSKGLTDGVGTKESPSSRTEGWVGVNMVLLMLTTPDFFPCVEIWSTGAEVGLFHFLCRVRLVVDLSSRDVRGAILFV